MADESEILIRLEAIEQTISAGLVVLIAMVQRLPQDQDYEGLLPEQIHAAIEKVKRAATEMGYNFPAT